MLNSKMMLQNNNSNSDNNNNNNNNNNNHHKQDFQKLKEASLKDSNGSVSIIDIGKIKHKVPGYNYEKRDHYIIHRELKDKSSKKKHLTNGDFFYDTKMPSLLSPFMTQEEFKEVIESIDHFKSLKKQKYNKITYVHLGSIIFLLIIIAICGWRKKIAPIIVFILMLIGICVSMVVIYRNIRPRHIRKDIKKFHKDISEKFKDRGVSFKPHLITIVRPYTKKISIHQDQIVVFFPKNDSSNTMSTLSTSFGSSTGALTISNGSTFSTL
ncbi:hypothetical protein DICPUDRAFT_149075 [Dictyostelium purpureum]|uniref:Uncharacterized protein n=1 Tax=Dictyostelium purpureum TaxID=5786 RepID=F0ZCS5_DICPU|nr:uncharacterized protein DICPUDRAFT_149075 [Dictyostelium purpureum]EGC38251.1 hypothetical protein DICPUDRAFT_149075 [Dictyostelium purpureum]|eukprot:XP_003285208.1 hypothetical protein DICPUDRAFT_149075 [Dictyostelium purpureum]